MDSPSQVLHDSEVFPAFKKPSDSPPCHCHWLLWKQGINILDLFITLQNCKRRDPSLLPAGNQMDQMSTVFLKETLKELCCLHTKRRLCWHQPSQAFFWYETEYRIVFSHFNRLYFIVCVISKEGLAGTSKRRLGCTGARQAFFWYDKDKDLLKDRDRDGF